MSASPCRAEHRVAPLALCLIALACGGPSGPSLGPGDLPAGQDTAAIDVPFAQDARTEILVDGGTDAAPQCTQAGQCALGNLCVQGTCTAGCAGDRDCPAGRPFCDPALGDHGACLQCRGETDCTNGAHCILGDCATTCTGNGDCTATPATPFCDLARSTCVGCRATGDCALGSICVVGACTPGCESDRDCPTDRFCDRAVAPHGGCFACVTDAACNGGACVDHACVGGTCAIDTDCGGGQYCHPLLHACKALPTGACTPSEGCASYVVGCDPLTRTCIPMCSVMDETCTIAGTADRPKCGPGNLCYGCLSNADCAGTACRPADRMCVRCTDDGACIAGGHCEVATGKCWPCIATSQCGTNQVCRPADHTCVECTKDTDCKVPGRPQCWSDATCHAACTADCTLDQTSCDPAQPDQWRSCGQFDADPCLDWSAPAACPTHQACSAGACACDDACAAGSDACDATNTMRVHHCVADASGCRYLQDETCSQSQICRSGKCDCEVYCTQTDRRCIAGDLGHFQACVPNSFTRCNYWTTYVCHTGTQCTSANVCTY